MALLKFQSSHPVCIIYQKFSIVVDRYSKETATTSLQYWISSLIRLRLELSEYDRRLTEVLRAWEWNYLAAMLDSRKIENSF